MLLLWQDLANASLADAGTVPAGTDFDGDGSGGDAEDGVSYRDVKNVFRSMNGLLDGPCPVPTLDQFVGFGSAIANDLGDGAYSQVVSSMESGWVFGNIVTQGTLHFAPAGEPAVG